MTNEQRTKEPNVCECTGATADVCRNDATLRPSYCQFKRPQQNATPGAASTGEPSVRQTAEGSRPRELLTSNRKSIPGLQSVSLELRGTQVALIYCFDSLEHAQAARPVATQALIQPHETTAIHPDTMRLEWLFRHVSGAEWRRLGAVYSAGMNRTVLNDVMHAEETKPPREKCGRKIRAYGVLVACTEESGHTGRHTTESPDGGVLSWTDVCDLCEDCPPLGYPTDETRCTPCPRRAQETTPESHYCIDCNEAHDPRTCGALGPEKASAVLTRICPGCNTVHSGPLCSENGSESTNL